MIQSGFFGIYTQINLNYINIFDVENQLYSLSQTIQLQKPE